MMNDAVDIICSVLDRERFLPDLFESLDRQTHTNWRLWMRDDGSSDGSMALMRARAATDPRTVVLHVGGPRLGAAGAYGWLLDRIRSDARYVMIADSDDVWLPEKIERTLGAMHSAEATYGAETPILIHSDMVIVDEHLRVLDESYWSSTGLTPEPATVRRHLVHTLTVGPTLMMNARLRTLVGTIPSHPRGPDSWIGLVAIALGRVVPLRERTVLYRRHGANDSVAARRPRLSLRELMPAIAHGLRNGPRFREWLMHNSGLATELLERHGERLRPADRRVVSGWAGLPHQRFLMRKLELLRVRVLPEHGLLRAVGVMLRG